MIAWYWLIVAFCAGIALAVFCNEYFDGGINVITEIISVIALVLLFVPIVFYHIFLKKKRRRFYAFFSICLNS